MNFNEHHVKSSNENVVHAIEMFVACKTFSFENIARHPSNLKS